MPSSRSMRIEKACTLLRAAVSDAGGVWADLGCGDGIFTTALHTLIRDQKIRDIHVSSEIYAVDKSQRALRALAHNFAQSYPDASVHLLQGDFSKPLSLPPLDGIVMANSLHFVRRKKPVLSRVATLLKPGGRLVIVEYNTSRGNFAVPHPLDENGFLELARQIGLQHARILSSIPSTFLGEMYSGMAFAAL